MTETKITADVMNVAANVVVDDSVSLVEVLAVSRAKNAADTTTLQHLEPEIGR